MKSDHESLQWLAKAEKGRIARWNADLADCNLCIGYKKGYSMHVVDYLSRHREEDPLLEEIYDKISQFLEQDSQRTTSRTATFLSPHCSDKNT